MIKQIAVVSKTSGDYIAYGLENVEDYKGVDGERALSHSFLMDTLRKLMGRTLTLIDASVPEERQNKAMKDVVRNMFSDEMDFSAQWAYDQKKLDSMIPENVEPEELGTVSIEEALGVS